MDNIFKINSSLQVTGSSGSRSLPYRDDLSQTCTYSISDDGKTVYIKVKGYQCASYSWVVTLN